MKLLPDRPNIDFLAREAKKIKSRHRNGDTSVCQTIGHFDTSLHGFTNQQILDTRFSITDAQRVVARLYGFASWTRLTRYIDLSTSGLHPSDPSLKHLIHQQHEQLRALQNDLKNKRGDYQTKYKAYRKLAQDSTGFLHTAFDKHGWPGPDVIGHDCMEAIWFISANAVRDSDFQKRTIRVASKALQHGGFWDYNFAALQDRFLTLTKKPTICGISFGSYYDNAGNFQLYRTDVVDPANLEKRRACAGYETQDAEFRQFAKEAKANDLQLPSRQKTIDELNRVSIEGGYTNH